MKKLSLIAMVALSATFFACSDDSSSTSATDSSKATCKVNKETDNSLEMIVTKSDRTITSTFTYSAQTTTSKSINITQFNSNASAEDYKSACEKELGEAFGDSVSCDDKNKTITVASEYEEEDAETFKEDKEDLKAKCEEIQKTGKTGEEDEDDINESERESTSSCISAEDNTAKIRYEYTSKNNVGTITRTYLPSVEDGVEAACEKAKEAAAANEKVTCTEDAVEVTSTFEKQSSEDFTAMRTLECISKE